MLVSPRTLLTRFRRTVSLSTRSRRRLPAPTTKGAGVGGVASAAGAAGLPLALAMGLEDAKEAMLPLGRTCDDRRADTTPPPPLEEEEGGTFTSEVTFKWEAGDEIYFGQYYGQK